MLWFVRDGRVEFDLIVVGVCLWFWVLLLCVDCFGDRLCLSLYW